MAFLAQGERGVMKRPPITTAAEQAPEATTSLHFMVTTGPSTLPRQAAARATVLATSPQRFEDAILSLIVARYEHCTIPTGKATPTSLFIRRSRLPTGPFFLEEATVQRPAPILPYPASKSCRVLLQPRLHPFSVPSDVTASYGCRAVFLEVAHRASATAFQHTVCAHVDGVWGRPFFSRRSAQLRGNVYTILPNFAEYFPSPDGPYTGMTSIPTSFPIRTFAAGKLRYIKRFQGKWYIK